MRNKDEFIIINELDKYYKYYEGYNVFTTLANRSIILTYDECLTICKRLTEPNFRKLKIVDKQIALRKYKLL